MWEESTRPPSHIKSSWFLLCSRVIIMQRCLKNKPGQTPSLALIVAVLDGQTHHHTSVISTSSIFSAGLRWFCVGGGGAARTWAGNKGTNCPSASGFSAWMKHPNPNQSFIQGHGPPQGGGVSEMFWTYSFNLIFTLSRWGGVILDCMRNPWIRFLPRLTASWAQEWLRP